MMHWVVDGSLFKMGSLWDEKDHVQISFGSAYAYPNDNTWNIVAVYDKKDMAVKIVRRTKEIKQV